MICIFIDGETGAKKALNNVPNVTQLVSGRTGILTHRVLVKSMSSLPLLWSKFPKMWHINHRVGRHRGHDHFLVGNIITFMVLILVEERGGLCGDWRRLWGGEALEQGFLPDAPGVGPVSGHAWGQQQRGHGLVKQEVVVDKLLLLLLCHALQRVVFPLELASQAVEG